MAEPAPPIADGGMTMTKPIETVRRLGIAVAMLPCLGSAAWAAGMPQMDFKNPLTTSQVVWGAILFALLYLLLARWALPQVGAVLEHRAAVIAADLAAAQAAKSESDVAVSELMAATRSAQLGAQGEIDAAVSEAKQAAAVQGAALNARLDAQLAAAEVQIASARSAALGALRQVATETAAVVVTRLTGQQADEAAVDAAVDQALAARRAA